MNVYFEYDWLNETVTGSSDSFADIRLSLTGLFKSINALMFVCGVTCAVLAIMGAGLFLILKNAPQEVRETKSWIYSICFGASGFFLVSTIMVWIASLAI